jgi:hypothetical protein
MLQPRQKRRRNAALVLIMAEIPIILNAAAPDRTVVLVVGMPRVLRARRKAAQPQHHQHTPTTAKISRETKPRIGTSVSGPIVIVWDDKFALRTQWFSTQSVSLTVAYWRRLSCRHSLLT